VTTQAPLSEAGKAQRAYAALSVVVPRLTGLIRSIKRPETPALGEWNVGDVAVHLAHVWETLPVLASGDLDSPLQHVDELSDLTTAMVRSETRPDLAGVADRIDAAAAAFLTTTKERSSDATTPWLVEGIQASTPTFACHLLNESLIHGYDIAHAERAPWAIPSAHAALALTGFMFPMVGRLDPRAMVNQESAAGVRASYEIHIRRFDRVFLSFDDGALRVEPVALRRVDCHVSADPAALFLVMWGRVNQWSEVLRGRLFAWGRKPWLGPRLRTMVRNP
jgi:Mycothiol maleylpyruvate isomerase N-terminal domain